MPAPTIERPAPQLRPADIAAAPPKRSAADIRAENLRFIANMPDLAHLVTLNLPAANDVTAETVRPTAPAEIPPLSVPFAELVNTVKGKPKDDKGGATELLGWMLPDELRGPTRRVEVVTPDVGFLKLGTFGTVRINTGEEGNPSTLILAGERPDMRETTYPLTDAVIETSAEATTFKFPTFKNTDKKYSTQTSVTVQPTGIERKTSFKPEGESKLGPFAKDSTRLKQLTLPEEQEGEKTTKYDLADAEARPIEGGIKYVLPATDHLASSIATVLEIRPDGVTKRVIVTQVGQENIDADVDLARKLQQAVTQRKAAELAAAGDSVAAPDLYRQGEGELAAAAAKAIRDEQLAATKAKKAEEKRYQAALATEKAGLTADIDLVKAQVLAEREAAQVTRIREVVPNYRRNTIASDEARVALGADESTVNVANVLDILRQGPIETTNPVRIFSSLPESGKGTFTTRAAAENSSGLTTVMNRRLGEVFRVPDPVLSDLAPISDEVGRGLGVNLDQDPRAKAVAEIAVKTVLENAQTNGITAEVFVATETPLAPGVAQRVTEVNNILTAGPQSSRRTR